MSAARYHGATDRGKVRSGNEDAFAVEPPLFVVADGLGGHQAGEVASGIAVDAVVELAPEELDVDALADSVRVANERIIRAAHEGVGREGMGTTVTAAVVRGTRIALAHAGDSRAYLLRDGRLDRLTHDHSVVGEMVRSGTLTEEEARHHPSRSVITRALGSDPDMPVDRLEVTASPGDLLLLCTDGLHGMLDEDAIADILVSAPDPRHAVDRLVSAALDAGGADNVTVVVVRVGADRDEPVSPKRRSAAYLLWVLVAVLLAATAAGGAYSYARSKAYLTIENGRVVVYRGLPGEFAGVRLRWPLEETTIDASALDPQVASRLAGDLEVDSPSEALELVGEYRLMAAEAETATPAETETATP